MRQETLQVWDEFSTGLSQFIHSRVANEHDAEDILQEVFIKVHTGLDSLRDNRKLKSWTYQIARNAVVDYYRARAKVKAEQLPDCLAARDDSTEIEALIELNSCVRKVIDHLPSPYRDSLVLAEFGHLTQREVAERLSLSLSGAKSRVQRARRKLKRLILDGCRWELEESGLLGDRNGRMLDRRTCRCDC